MTQLELNLFTHFLNLSFFQSFILKVHFSELSALSFFYINEFSPERNIERGEGGVAFLEGFWLYLVTF